MFLRFEVCVFIIYSQKSLCNLICLSYGVLVEKEEAIFIQLDVFRDDRVERCCKRQVVESISKKRMVV